MLSVRPLVIAGLLALTACSKPSAPASMVLSVSGAETPIKTVLVMHRAGEKPNESASVAFFGGAVECADAVAALGKHDPVSLLGRGINADFTTQSSDALVWTYQATGAAPSKQLMFDNAAGKHTLKITRGSASAGPNGAHGEVDLDVDAGGGARFKLSGSFDAKICP